MRKLYNVHESVLETILYICVCVCKIYVHYSY